MSAATTQRARRSVLVAYAILSAVGAGFFLLSFQYDFSVRGGLVGPGFLPRIAGGALAVIGLLLVAQELRGGSVLKGDSGSDEAAERISRSTAIKLVAVFAGITIALLVTPVIGLLPAFTLLVLALMLFVERMPVLPSILIAVTAGVVAHLLFGVALQVPLPLGVFEGVLA